MSRTEREKRSAKRKQPVDLYLQRVTVRVYQHAINAKRIWQILRPRAYREELSFREFGGQKELWRFMGVLE